MVYLLFVSCFVVVFASSSFHFFSIFTLLMFLSFFVQLNDYTDIDLVAFV